MLKIRICVHSSMIEKVFFSLCEIVLFIFSYEIGLLSRFLLCHCTDFVEYYTHSAAKWPILRFRNGVGRSTGTVLGLIYID